MHRSTRNNAYAFEVHKLATKSDVRRAVEELFNVNACVFTHKPAKASRAAPGSKKELRAIGKKQSSRWIKNTGLISSRKDKS